MGVIRVSRRTVGFHERSTKRNGGNSTDQIRRQIEHEDNLITQRLSWLLASQSFLFTAYSIVLTGLHPGENSGTPLELSKLGLCHFLPVAGIVSSALIYASICGGMLAIRQLRQLWDERHSIALLIPSSTHPEQWSCAHPRTNRSPASSRCPYRHVALPAPWERYSSLDPLRADAVSVALCS